MQQRSLWDKLAGGGWLPLRPPWARAQAQWGRLEAANLAALAAVVLPASLGEARRAAIAEEFLARTHDVELERRYRRQLRTLGVDFASLAPSSRRVRLQAALEAAGATEIPAHPNGRHLAADLISAFFRDTSGEAGTTALPNPGPLPH